MHGTSRISSNHTSSTGGLVWLWIYKWKTDMQSGLPFQYQFMAYQNSETHVMIPMFRRINQGEQLKCDKVTALWLDDC